MKQPTMVYKHPGKHKIHGSYFDYKIVDISELKKSLEEGWYLTTSEAKNRKEDNSIRQELEKEAEGMGIKFPPNIKTETLIKNRNTN